ncbi:MAG: tetratricopeptide repeat protein [Chloroflexota bacterium]
MADRKETDPQLIADRYAVVNRFEGGMGLVYFCRDVVTNELVGLKTFKPEYLPNRAARDLFLREGTTWVELGHHPNIVRAHRIERVGSGQAVYLVLEWIVEPEGKSNPSLRSWLRPERPLPLQQSLLFTLHIARGMRHATHKIAGFVHRDLKPENVLVGYDNRARVTDFGLARTLSGMDETTAGQLPGPPRSFVRTRLTHGMAGTPLYMSPEQWARQPLDERADIYALGCILYEMLSGRFAALADSVDGVRAIHLSGRVAPPPANTPRDVVIFLTRCMATERDQRYRTWQQVEEALTAVYRSLFGEVPAEETAVSSTPATQLAMARSYNTMGLSYLDIGKPAVAIIYFEQAVWVGRQQADKQLEGAALGNLGAAYAMQGYYERAIEFHREHLQLARESSNAPEMTRALGNLGSVYQQKGDVERGIEFHQKQLQLARQLGDQAKEASALGSLGDAHRLLGQTEPATQYYKQSLDIARTIQDQSRMRKIMTSMGRLYVDNGEHKKAATLLAKALEMARKTADRVTEGEVLRHMGQLYQRAGHVQRAVDAYQSALKIAEESHDVRQEAYDRLFLGELYLAQGEGQQAIEQYEAALLAFQMLKDSNQILAATDRLGDAYLAWGDVGQAANVQKEALMLAEAAGERTAVQRALFKMGVAYEKWGDTERTQRYFERHLALSQEAGDTAGELMMLCELGKLEIRRSQYPSALRYYQRLQERAVTAADWWVVGNGLNWQGDVQMLLGAHKEAAEFYKAALELAQAQGDEGAEAVALANLAVANQHTGWRWTLSRPLDKALKLAEESGSETAVAHTQFKMAELLLLQEKIDQARIFARRAHVRYEKLGDEEGVARVATLTAVLDNPPKSSRRFPF